MGVGVDVGAGVEVGKGVGAGVEVGVGEGAGVGVTVGAGVRVGGGVAVGVGVGTLMTGSRVRSGDNVGSGVLAKTIENGVTVGRGAVGDPAAGDSEGVRALFSERGVAVAEVLHAKAPRINNAMTVADDFMRYSSGFFPSLLSIREIRCPLKGRIKYV